MLIEFFVEIDYGLHSQIDFSIMVVESMRQIGE